MAVMTLPDWRAENNKTQTDVAEKIGVSTRAISHIEKGGNTDFENLRKIYELTDGQVTPNMIILGKPA